MKILSIISMVMFMSLITSCEKSSDCPGIGPFSTGSSERNLIVVISDMHMGADMDYSECNNNIGPLEKLLQQIRTAPNVKEVVIAGDLIDEWFVPANVNTYLGKEQSDFVQRLAAANSGVFAALNQIIQEKKILVTYVPGNHDLGITAASVDPILPGINQARDARGLGTYIPASMPLLAIEHGHRFNFACAPDPISNQESVPGSILPFTNNGIKSIYANSGTWIDEKSGEGGTTMNFVVITPQSSDVSSKTYVKLYNFEGEVVNKMAEDSLHY